MAEITRFVAAAPVREAAVLPLMPDSPRGSLLLGISVIAVFFVAFGAWAATAPLDSAVLGQGVVTVDGNRKSVAQPDGGSVTEIDAKEGQHVAAGELLLRLDDTKARAQRDVDRQQLIVAQIHLARLQSEVQGADFINFPRDVVDSGEGYANAAMSDELVDFEARRATLTQVKDAATQQATQIDAQIAGKQARIAADQAQIGSMDKEKNDLAGLLSGGLTTKDRSLDLDRSIQQLNADIADSNVAIGALRQSGTQIQLQAQQAESARRAEATTDLVATSAKVLQLRASLDNSQSALDRLSVKAPYDGKVVNLTVFSTGAVLPPGATILDIVPDKLPLVVDARVAVDDVAGVKVGDIAEVHFPAFNRPDLPAIEGKVTRISADRLVDEHSGVPYFAVEVAVNPIVGNKDDDLSLYPGMSVSVTVHAEHRTALQYLTEPLFETLSASFRQR